MPTYVYLVTDEHNDEQYLLDATSPEDACRLVSERILLNLTAQPAKWEDLIRLAQANRVQTKIRNKEEK